VSAPPAITQVSPTNSWAAVLITQPPSIFLSTPLAEPDKLRWQGGGSLGCYYTPVGVPVGDKARMRCCRCALLSLPVMGIEPEYHH
jgi:hypothetical protein